MEREANWEPGVSMVFPGLCTSQHLSSLLITEDNKSLLLKLIEFLPFATGILTNIIDFINWTTMPAERRPSQSHMVSLQLSASCQGNSNCWYSRSGWLVDTEAPYILILPIKVLPTFRLWWEETRGRSGTKPRSSTSHCLWVWLGH